MSWSWFERPFHFLFKTQLRGQEVVSRLSCLCTAAMDQLMTLRPSEYSVWFLAFAQFPVGEAIALYQVLIYYQNGSWEVAATESTQITPCPADLLASLTQTTDVGADGISLTQAVSIDYDTAHTRPATLSGLASVIRPSQVRTLPGIFEVHSTAVMGVASALSNGDFQMRACAKCKTSVAEDPGLGDSAVCSTHPDAGVEDRWLFSLHLKDQHGGCQAMLYHDAASTLPFLTGVVADAKALPKIVRAFRAIPWSLRLVFKANDYKQTNYLEVKRMVPTLTAEGIVAAFRLLPAPHAQLGEACPFAYCASVKFDVSLGSIWTVFKIQSTEHARRTDRAGSRKRHRPMPTETHTNRKPIPTENRAICAIFPVLLSTSARECDL